MNRHQNTERPQSELASQLHKHFPQLSPEEIAKFEAHLYEQGITEERNGYRLNFVGREYARLQAGLPSDMLISPDTEHNAMPENVRSGNVFITGDNLEALRHLQNAYAGKVKMIYIDPPYNTGKEFVYNDKFELSDEKLRQALGYSDDDIARLRSISGKSSHSAWLTFMYPRLALAKKLLANDGVIFVSIDDNEQANLKLLMDDVFGEGNFKNTIAVRRGTKSVQAQFENIDKLGIAFEYVLMYSKSDIRLDKFHFDLDDARDGAWNNHWRGTDRPTMRYELLGITPDKGQWRWSHERSMTAIANYTRMIAELKNNNPSQKEIDDWYLAQLEEIDLLRLSQQGKPEHYIAPTSQKFGHNLWTDMQVGGTAELKKLNLNLFDNPKNPDLVKRMVQWTTKPGDLILDFFAGSGTTAHAVMQLNAEDGVDRKWIMVQLDEPTAENSEARKVPFNFTTIDQISRERIRRAGDKTKSERSPDLFDDKTAIDTGFKHYRLIEPEVQTLDKIETFDPNLGGFEDMITPMGGRETILTTWLIDDGYPFDTKIEEIIFDGYAAHYVVASQTLYLIDSGMTTAALRAILNRIGRDELVVSMIVAYPYSFEFERMRELEIGVKMVDDLKLNKRY